MANYVTYIATPIYKGTATMLYAWITVKPVLVNT